MKDNYTGEYYLWGIGSIDLDRTGKASFWHYSYKFRNETHTSEISIGIYHNGTIKLLESELIWNQSVWDSFKNSMIIENPVIDSNEAIDIMFSQQTEIKKPKDYMLLCTNFDNSTTWLLSSNNVEPSFFIYVDAMTGDLIGYDID